MDETGLHALLLRALGGDDQSYQSFLQVIARPLRIYIRRGLADSCEQAENLVQDVLIAIHRKRETFDARQPATAWVEAIARFKACEYLRRCKRSARVCELTSFRELVGASDFDGGGDPHAVQLQDADCSINRP